MQTLFGLDSDRTLTAIEGAIHSYDPVVRRRAAMALVVWEVPLIDRNLSILLHVIDDRLSAVTSIVELDSVKILPILLEIANSHELVATLIWRLLEHHRSGTGVIIFEEFRRNREIAIDFLETAEKSLIAAIENNIGSLSLNIFRLGEIGSDLAIFPLQKNHHVGGLFLL